MFNEPGSTLDDAPSVSRRAAHLRSPLIDSPSPLEPDVPFNQESHYSEIHAAVESVMTVASEQFAIQSDTEDQRRNLFLMSRDSKLLMTFKGRLRVDSETAYAQLDALFKPYDLLPIFRSEPEQTDTKTGITLPPHHIYVVQGRTKPQDGGGWLSLILFILTVLSVLFVGSLMAMNERGTSLADPLSELWRGYPYAASILLILGAHELGHYFAARYHKTAASLPYFLPFPLGIFGTFGAAIRLREPMRNRKVLLDIGAAGPLAGLVFAIPILLIGLATSEVDTMSGGLVEGNSILYAASKILVFGEFLPNGSRDVFVNQLAWAGWTGLLVTGLNLIPVGQLDGGHILYSLLGRYAKVLYYPIIGALIMLTILVASELLIFVMLILLMGNLHAVPLDDITPLDPRRRGVAILALVVFVLVFVPTPLQESDFVPLDIQDTPVETFMLPVGMILLWQAVRNGWRPSLFRRR